MDRNLTIVLLTFSLANAVWSMTALAQDRDPFFSSGPRATASAPSAPDTTWGRDPFARPFEGNSQRAPVQGDGGSGKGLTGIIYGTDVRIAIIDGEIYHIGDAVGGRTLSDIRPRSIVFVGSTGSREEIFLEDFSIRK